MVVPYSAGSARAAGDANDATPAQQHFLRLLLHADSKAGSHLQALQQRAAQAEQDVAQLRQLFQQWQLRLLQQQVEQLQVQRQLVALHDALTRQQRTEDAQQPRVQEQLRDLFGLHRQQAHAQHQHLGRLQLRLCSLERTQRANRRQLPLGRRRQDQQQSEQSPLRGEPSARPRCPDDDCCPCEHPEECPFNPCLLKDEEQFQEEVGPEDCCLLRDIRLGLINNPSGFDRKPMSSRFKRQETVLEYSLESENGYMADDEASSSSSGTSSLSSASFLHERRRHVQEIRSLKNTHIEPRYNQTWKPLRCFQCGSPDHLSTFCHLQTTSL